MKPLTHDVNLRTVGGCDALQAPSGPATLDERTRDSTPGPAHLTPSPPDGDREAGLSAGSYTGPGPDGGDLGGWPEAHVNEGSSLQRRRELGRHSTWFHSRRHQLAQ